MAKTKATIKAKTSAPRANSRPNRRKPMSPEATTKGSASNPAPAAPAASAGSPERGAASIRYVDRADMVETFADSVTGLIFDGQTLRIEFGVTRFDDVKPNAPITGRRYPACRLVLPPVAAVDLINRMQQIAAALTQAGVVKAAQRPATPPPKAG
ncbi:MAG TPA: hypothetical protein VFN27_10135 [Xanthobacteraceae bacterium]|nr:hypothetical protein [Xanthobacteraceae bacterium]